MLPWIILLVYVLIGLFVAGLKNSLQRIDPAEASYLVFFWVIEVFDLLWLWFTRRKDGL